MREMSVHEPTLDESASVLASRRVLPVLLLLFLGSGCSALIYEIVWFQLLELVIGSSTISLGRLLGTFMGGMGRFGVFGDAVSGNRRWGLLDTTDPVDGRHAAGDIPLGGDHTTGRIVVG